MGPSFRSLLLGSDAEPTRRVLTVLLPSTAFAATFALYAAGVFRVSGGVIFLAADAAAVGVLGAFLVGYARTGWVFGVLATLGALLGHNADHYLLGLSGRSLAERLGAFLELDALAFTTVQALVVGTLAWTAGTALSLAVAELRTSEGGEA